MLQSLSATSLGPLGVGGTKGWGLEAGSRVFFTSAAPTMDYSWFGPVGSRHRSPLVPIAHRQRKFLPFAYCHPQLPEATHWGCCPSASLSPPSRPQGFQAVCDCSLCVSIVSGLEGPPIAGRLAGTCMHLWWQQDRTVWSLFGRANVNLFDSEMTSPYARDAVAHP